MKFSTKWLLQATVILSVLVIAGPEFGIGLELFAISELLGTELFLLSFLIGFRMLSTAYVINPTIAFLQRIDPYFFLPTRHQVAVVPGIVAHAIPGFVATYIGWILMTSLPTEV